MDKESEYNNKNQTLEVIFALDGIKYRLSIIAALLLLILVSLWLW